MNNIHSSSSLKIDLMFLCCEPIVRTQCFFSSTEGLQEMGLFKGNDSTEIARKEM